MIWVQDHLRPILLALATLALLALLVIFFPYSVYEVLNNAYFLSFLIIATSALIVSAFSFGQYRRQKDHEEIYAHYLNNIDELLSQLYGARVILENNFVSTLQVLQRFRDMPPEAFSKWLQMKSVNYEPISAQMPKSFIVCAQLFNREYFNQVVIENISGMAHSNEFFIGEFPITISGFIEGDPQKYQSRELRILAADELHDRAIKKIDVLRRVKTYELIQMIEALSFTARKMDISSYGELEHIVLHQKIKKQLDEIDGLWQSIKKEAEE